MIFILKDFKDFDLNFDFTAIIPEDPKNITRPRHPQFILLLYTDRPIIRRIG